MFLSPLIWKLSGPREEVTLDEAENVEFPEDSHPVQIDISCRVWKAETLQAVPFPVEAMKNVKMLKVDDIIASLPTEQGLATLRYVAEFFTEHCPNLEQVDLKDNAVGTRGIEALGPLLTLKLTHLNLRNTGIAEADALTLKDMLHADCLLSLDFSRNSLGPGGAQHFGELLARCTQLESFSYAGSRCVTLGTKYLCEGLSELKNIQYLDMEDCEIGNNDITPCLRNCKQLKYLNLEGNSITNEKLEEILTAVADASLVYLNLSGNDEFDTEGGEILMSYLKSSPRTLRTLKLGSALLGDDGVTALLKGLRDGHKVEELHLDCNLIESTVMFHPPLAGLKILNLIDNMDISGVEELAKVYPETSIQIDEEMLEDLDEALVADLANLKV